MQNEIPKKESKRSKLGIALGSGAVVFMTVYMLLIHGTKLKVSLTLKSDVSTAAQAYWTENEIDFFDEKHAYWFSTKPGSSTYNFTLPAKIKKLRIEPGRAPGIYEISKLTISDLLDLTIVEWGGDKGFSEWYGANQISNFLVEEGSLKLQAVGNDPILLMRPVDFLANRVKWHFLLFAFIVSVASVVLVVDATSRFNNKRHANTTG